MGKNGCNSPFITKKERNKLVGIVGNMDLCDEDSVWDVGVELGLWSVRLRSEVLSRLDGD